MRLWTRRLIQIGTTFTEHRASIQPMGAQPHRPPVSVLARCPEVFAPGGFELPGISERTLVRKASARISLLPLC